MDFSFNLFQRWNSGYDDGAPDQRMLETFSPPPTFSTPKFPLVTECNRTKKISFVPNTFLFVGCLPPALLGKMCSLFATS